MAAKTKYVVLVAHELAVGDDRLEAWVEHSLQEAPSDDSARKAAVLKDPELRRAVESESPPRMVAVPARNWNPKTPGLKPRDPVLSFD